MSNIIQIKRSITAIDPSTLTGAGELSYSYASNKLFIGSSNGVGSAATAIGGPGMFTNYALLTSPAFTGSPSAPTPTLTDNSTSIATTAFVKGQGYVTGNQNITVTGDASGSGTNAITLTLSSTGVTLGEYTKLTVDSKGRITSATVLVDTDIPTLTSGKISNFDTQVRTSSLNQFAAATSNVSLNGFKLTNLATPTQDTDAATKAYADAASQGLTVKDAVKVATTENLDALVPGGFIDGVTLEPGDRILVKDQITKSQNGIYLYAGPDGTLIRTLDADADNEVKTGLFVFVTEGETNKDSGYYLGTINPITLGTTNLEFVIFSRAGQITAGAGLTKTGTSVDVVTADSSRITVNADSIDLATTGITSGQYTKLNVDVYGRAITGSNPTTLAEYGIVDAQAQSGRLDTFVDHINTRQALGVSGFLAFDGEGAFYSQQFIDVSNRTFISAIAAGVVTIDISGNYVGQPSITTLGTISTATWNASTIGLAYGGTGSTSFTATHIPYSDGTKLVGNSNLTWNNATNTLTVAGSINGSVIDGGQF